MTLKIFFSAFFIINFNLLTPKYQGLPASFEHKIERLTKKTFHKKAILFKEKKIDANLMLSSDFQVFDIFSANKKIGTATLNRTNSCRIGGCSRFKEHTENDAYEKFFYLCIFDNKHNLLKINILEYESDYGYEVTSRGWLKQFERKTEKEFEYSKNIDAISGATISAKSVISDVNKQLNFIRQLKL